MSNFTQAFSFYDLPFLTRGVKLPDFIMEKSHKDRLGLPDNCSHYEFLRALTLEGFAELKLEKGSDKYKEYAARAKKELDTFKDLGFCAYLLITWDIIRFCHEKGIPVGAGRGSCCGSLVLFLCHVTKIDSVKHGLFFERFLSKTRAKFVEYEGSRYYQGDLLMDIDLDISFRERHKVAKYVEDRYSSCVCKMLTLSTYSSKILVKEVGKSYLGMKEEDVKLISDMIPKEFGVVKSIEDAREENPQFAEFCDSHKGFEEICQKMAGLYTHAGCHASAWVISADPLGEMFPLELNADDEIITGYSMDDTLNMACKVDLLGLRCASLIDSCAKMLGIDYQDIDVNHPSIYAALQDLKTPRGLFQIEADTNYKVLRKVKPRNLDDLTAIISLGRPGSLQFVDIYQKYVQTGEFQSVHPLFDDVLKESAGIPIYQESLMRCANKIGFSLEEAEILRRIAGKKKKEEVGAWKEKISAKIKENDLDEKAGDILWDILEASASYSFNKSHGAAYASMCASTVYLKFNHPLQFFTSLLNLAKDEPAPHEELTLIQKEMIHFGIELLPPDFMKSKVEFSIEGNNIRYGFCMVRGLSEKNFTRLENFRSAERNSKFAVFQAFKQAGLNIGLSSAFIQAGCLGDIAPEISRSRLTLECQTFNLLTDKEKALCITLADKPEVNHDVLKAIIYLRDNKDEKGKPLFSRATRFGTIKKKYEKYKEIWEMNRRNERLANYFYERTILGYSYSETLRDIFGEAVDGLMSVSDVEAAKQDDKVRMIGFVKEPIKSKSKAGNDMFRFALTDETGEIAIRFFNQTIDQVFVTNGRLPIEGDLVLVKATKKEGSCCFANEIGIQTAKIYMKLSELKEAGEKAETGLAADPAVSA